MTIDSFIQKISEVILNPIIILMFAIALVVFLWGVFQMIRNASSEEERETGKRAILWGIVGMTIMVSAFGIIRVLLTSFNIETRPLDRIEKR